VSAPLRLVPGAREAAPAPRVAFCGHCGLPPDPGVPAGATRVCRRCNLGLLLEAAPALVPTPGEPFLVVDGRLAVCGVSRSAEELLAVEETDAVNRHVTEFLVPAGTETPRPENLLAQIVAAAGGDAEPRTVVVRPSGLFGVRLWARVGACGPSPAALLVLSS
jgi:hypothetical protein